MTMTTKKIEILELLRFISLTEVFLIHYMNDFILSDEGLNILMVSGKLGVAFFFMITGYLLVHTTNPNKKGFLKKKLTQLLPKYEILLVFIFIASKIAPNLFRTFDVSNINFIKSIFLIPYKTPGVPFACPMLPVAWTLGVQIALFIFFWIMMSLLKSVDRAAIITVIVIIALFAMGSISGYDNIILFAYGRLYMLYFATGIMFALAEKKIRIIAKIEEKNSVCDRKMPLWLCVIILVVFLFGSCFYLDNLFCYALVSISFVVSIIFGKNVEMPQSIMFMGKTSYSFFLIHYLVCKVFTRVLHLERTVFTTIIMLLGCYGVVIIASFAYDEIFRRLTKAIKVGKG